MLTKHLFKIAIRNGFSAETELISKPIVETIFLFFKFVRAFIFDSQKVRNLIQLRPAANRERNKVSLETKFYDWYSVMYLAEFLTTVKMIS